MLLGGTVAVGWSAPAVSHHHVSGRPAHALGTARRSPLEDVVLTQRSFLASRIQTRLPIIAASLRVEYLLGAARTYFDLFFHVFSLNFIIHPFHFSKSRLYRRQQCAWFF